VLEATVHGLAEVIERDVRSFQITSDTSFSVSDHTLPDSARRIAQLVRAADLALFVKYANNVFGLPYFTAIVAETDLANPIYVSGGYGCHPCKEIALNRAVCEALQSRLSFIHGGRDDLTDHYARFTDLDLLQRAAYTHTLFANISTAKSPVDYGDIPDRTEEVCGLESALKVMLSSVAQAAVTTVCRVIYTKPDDLLQVVRILVPRLEFFTETAPRLGIRFRDYVESRS
jgi:ribosomal protein S12 methylthiotransferase accessory factor